MGNLQATIAELNNHLNVCSTVGRLSSKFGLKLVNKFMDSDHFTGLSKKIIPFNKDHCYWLHGKHKTLKKLFQN